MSRFDYVKYDVDSAEIQSFFKESFEALENLVEQMLASGRAKALVFTKLEEAYMWVGKAIRDAQVSKHGIAELQESRSDS